MVRAISRTAFILLIAGVIATALYLVIGPGESARSAERRARSAAGAVGENVSPGQGRERNGRWDGRRGGGARDRGERHGREEASFGHGAAGVIGTVAQVGAVGAIVVLLRRRGRRPARANGPATSSP